MASATLRVKSNAGLVSLSEMHPDSSFTILGAWPESDSVRTLLESESVEPPSLVQTAETTAAILDFELRFADDSTARFEVTTALPKPHGAMADSGVVPSFPLHLEDGWLSGEVVASREQLSAFRIELDDAGLEYELLAISPTERSTLLTDRQRDVLELAAARGYYDTPRRSTITDLACELGVNKSVVSRILHRAEGRLVSEHLASPGSPVHHADDANSR